MESEFAVEIYGIRHHGAGSSRNLLEALASFQPEIILIECPADCQDLISYVQDDYLVPPVAILTYDKHNPQRCAYYPFTVFSPEWQAMIYGFQAKAEIKFFDLPQSQSFLLRDSKKVVEIEDGWIHDPFSYMADLAGYDDPERWWDNYIEQQGSAPKIFEYIKELMTEMRLAGGAEKHTNVVREAHMRQEIRSAIKDGYRKIAVVCGAWHSPALDIQSHDPSMDRKTLKGLKKLSTACTWVPWSYSRIARHAGYSSGVMSPYWYEVLFLDPDNAVSKWMSRTARMMNDMGKSISPAHVIEGTRMASALALMRDNTNPGIFELFDAISAVYCKGDDALIEKMKIKLLEGENVGVVSEDIPMVPLQRDLEAQIKKARLTKDWRSSSIIEKHFDLRKKTHLLASRLLYKMSLLGIPWGEEEEPDNNPLGTFHEYWTLEWIPDFEILIIEASLWGNTMEEATINLVTDQLTKESNFEHLGLILYRVLHAHIPELIGPVTQKIKDLGNVSQDVSLLMKITPPLILSLRYGDTAQLNTIAVGELLEQIFPRICLLLPGQVKDISEEVAQDLFRAMLQVHQTLQLINHQGFHDNWLDALKRIANDPRSNPVMKGAAVKILLAKNEMSSTNAFQIIRYELSSISDPFYPAYFLEGFMSGGGWLLVHRPVLTGIIDDWLTSLSEEDFLVFLPIIRRTFSTFTESEKTSIFRLISGKLSSKTKTKLDKERRDVVLPALRKLL